MPKGYSIIVGRERPETVLVAHVDKVTQTPKGEQFETQVSVGTHLIINLCRVWGRRIAKDKDGKLIKKDRIEVTDPEYKGELEFLKWGDPKGYILETRFLPQSHSLDAVYQEQIQKIVLSKNDPRDVREIFLELSSGENKFDYSKDALLIQHLQNHPVNRDSISKNPKPEIMGEVFYEKTDERIGSKNIEKIESGLEAALIVKEASKDTESLRNLFDIISKGSAIGNTDLLSKDREIYEVLLNFAQGSSDVFFMNLNDYKKRVSDDFVKAKAFELLDLTKAGNISFNNAGKKELLIEGAEGKEDEMIEWVLQHSYEPKVYEKLKHLNASVLQLQ